MGKTALIFPGQGAQKAGMGKDFYENSETARRIFDQAGDWLGFDMKALCFEPNDQLDITEYTQAAMVTTSLAMLAVLQERGLKADVAAGLSLGEYCALAAAGAMSVEDAVKIVRQRGILMQQAVPAGVGSMAAVLMLSPEKIEEVIAPVEGVEIANYNCPGQIVISGFKGAVEEASEKLKEAGAKRVLPLNVSGPFHSPLLKEAGEKLGEVLAPVELSLLQMPYVTNVTAQYIHDTAEIKNLLVRQVYSSVRWQQSVEAMLADGVDTFIEIGPGKTLTSFVKKINRKANLVNIETWSDMEKFVC
ncbi:MAG: ACP S-malonyltransferase [Lachnospiraceae bacterium]|nr:ACP S-malonyltransferase [Lachnospiraceae bacterium]